MHTIVCLWAVDKGVAELKSKGIATYSLQLAKDRLYQGFMSQDDYDLFFDVWMASSFKYSVPEMARNAAYNRLIERYGGE